MGNKKAKVMEYKAYYHILETFPEGLICFGSNEPGHPKGSCVNPKHPLAAKKQPKG